MAGMRTDTAGSHWSFDIDGLSPATAYRISLEAGGPLCDPWPLATFPAPGAAVDRLRLLSFTCAGGYPPIGQPEAFRPLAVRHALIDRALSFRPDAAIANGDHVYWDLKTALDSPNAAVREATQAAFERLGYLDERKPVLGSGNEAILKRVAGPQIADVYGTRFRSLPTFFVTDDHDYFENDEADARRVTFPPDDFEVRLQQVTQALYYPEFLPDPARPPLSGAGPTPKDPAASFGALRYGDLAEVLLYDCGRFLSLKGAHAGLVPPEVEAWLIDRTRGSDARHVIHAPSHPFGWSAGKWREWYPDVVVQGRLGVTTPKFMWQPGWFAQHQRLLAAMCGHAERAAVMLSGDLHAVGSGRITRSGELSVAGNPLHTVLSGPLGTSTFGWPSAARGVAPQPPAALAVEGDAPVEKNGFTLLDIDRRSIRVRQFAWREPQPVTAIPTLEPFRDFRIERRA